MVQHSRGDNTDDFTSGPLTDEFYEMLRQGRSFSGKERNCCFLNTFGDPRAAGQFANVSAISGIDFPDDGRAVAHIDWDHDGDLDLWISNRTAPRLRLLRNDIGLPNEFVQFRLIGNGVDTNRNAVGAQVKVVLAPDSGTGSNERVPAELIQTMYAGDGFLSQGTHWLHFGLGSGREVQRVLVRWPDQTGDWEEFPAVRNNGHYELQQGSAIARPVNLDRPASVLQPSRLDAPSKPEKHRIPLVFQLPAPPVTWSTFDGRVQELGSSGEAVLINFWSSTCRPCLVELEEFSRRYDELRSQGIRIAAVNIDHLTEAMDEDAPDPSIAAAQVAKRLEMPFEVGMADPLLVDRLQRLHNTLIKMERPLPMPSSFLVDRDGNLDVIYKGPVEVDTLLADAGPASDNSVLARFQRAAAFPGTVIHHDAAVAPLEIEGSAVHLRLAKEFTKQGRMQLALRELEKGIKISPDSPIIQNDYGVLLKLQGQLTQAATHFRRAIELDPTRAGFRINLAQVLIAKNKLGGASDQLHQVLEEAPGHSDAHFYLGTIQLKTNNRAAARKSFQTAVQCNPEHARALFSLGAMHVQGNQLDEAREYFERALEITPRESVILASLARLLLMQGKTAEAEAKCRLAMETKPDNPEAHFCMGMIYQARQDYTRARQCFQDVLRLAPGHPGALQALGQN